MKPDVAQIIFALERQRDALDAQADRLHRELDYTAEFPAEDADRMREAIELLKAQGLPLPVLQALRFYGQGEHIVDAEDQLASVSGELSNWLSHETDPVMVEDGWVARAVLTGQPVDWVSEGEDTTPEPIEGEIVL